jgi:cell division protein FtsL
MYLNPYALVFWFIKHQDFKRIARLEKEECIKNTLPVSQQMSFRDGFQEGFEYCAKFCIIDEAQKKPEYSNYIAEEARKRSKEVFPKREENTMKEGGRKYDSAEHVNISQKRQTISPVWLILFVILSAVLLGALYVRDRQLVDQVEALSAQVEQLQQEYNTLSEDNDTLSTSFSYIIKSFNSLEGNIRNAHSDIKKINKYMPDLLHQTRIHKGAYYNCEECTALIVGQLK